MNGKKYLTKFFFTIINIEIRTNQFHMKYSINQRKNAVDSLEQTGLHQAQVQMKDQIQHSTVK